MGYGSFEPAEGFCRSPGIDVLFSDVLRLQVVVSGKKNQEGGSRKTLSVPKEHKDWNYSPKSGNEIILNAVLVGKLENERFYLPYPHCYSP